jgi:hypothetical protein
MQKGQLLDTIQGHDVGPSEPGLPPKDFPVAILDPGSRAFEAGTKPGILYCMLSRGTTIGDLDGEGKRMNSAIYFHDFGLSLAGVPLSATRLAELCGPVGNPGKQYAMITRRDRWVDHLRRNSHGSGMTEAEIDNLFEWVQKTRIPPERVDRWIKKITAAYTADVP